MAVFILHEKEVIDKDPFDFRGGIDPRIAKLYFLIMLIPSNVLSRSYYNILSNISNLELGLFFVGFPS